MDKIEEYLLKNEIQEFIDSERDKFISIIIKDFYKEFNIKNYIVINVDINLDIIGKNENLKNKIKELSTGSPF